jgi:hypothetical protein
MNSSLSARPRVSTQVHDDALKAFTAANSSAKQDFGGQQPASLSVNA